MISYSIAKEMDLPVSVLGIILTASIASFLGGLPIQGIAGFGTVEASWTLPLVIGLGVPVESAVTYSFVMHTIFLGYGLMMGVLSIFFVTFNSRL